jgi:alanine dehydrogenase
MSAPLALLDSIEITRQRTAAVTAVATQYLARPDSRTATICGCGEQGRIQLRALRHKLELSQIFAWDIDPETSRRFAAEMAAELGIDVTAIDHLREGTLVSDAIVTCTPARLSWALRTCGRERLWPRWGLTIPRKVKSSPS